MMTQQPKIARRALSIWSDRFADRKIPQSRRISHNTKGHGCDSGENAHTGLIIERKIRASLCSQSVPWPFHGFPGDLFILLRAVPEFPSRSDGVRW